VPSAPIAHIFVVQIELAQHLQDLFRVNGSSAPDIIVLGLQEIIALSVSNVTRSTATSYKHKVRSGVREWC
jgi:hypothetical protein